MPKRDREETHAGEVRPAKQLDAYILRWRSNAYEAPASVPSDEEKKGSTLHRPPKPIFLCSRRSAGASQHQSPIALGETTFAAETGIVFHSDMLLHRHEGHREVERPERVSLATDHLDAVGLLQRCVRIPASRASSRDLLRVHDQRHIDFVDQLEVVVEVSGEASLSVGTDLYASKATSRAARLAAGSVTAAALAVCRGDVQNALALVRPPGHHCSSRAAGGFCFFNNVAVAVRAAQEHLAASAASSHSPSPHRILIVDWDVHHGDGTEEVFYNDPSVLVFSVHQYGSKPGHVVRRPHRVAPVPTEVEVTLEELGDLVADVVPAGGGEGSTGRENENDGVASAPTPNDEAQEDHVSPVADAAEPPRRQRNGQPINFKALAATVADRDADDLFKTAGMLQDDDGPSDATYSVGTDRDDNATTTTNSDWLSDGSDSDGAARSSLADARLQFPGDTLGTSSTAEEVDQRELFYPGSGHMDRVGDADGEGRNINVPWPTSKLGDLEYLMVLEELLVPVATEFNPHLVFVSCGFDCAEGDPLGEMRVTPTGFRMMMRLVLSLGKPVVVALEGGYNLTQVALGAEGILRELLAASHRSDPEWCPPNSTMLLDRTEALINAVRATHAPYWQSFAK